MRPPVMWGIPCDEIMYSRFFTFFVKHAGVMPTDKFAISENTYLPKARNIIHRAFLKETDFPYLMMLDSDVMFPPNIAASLMAHNLPMVGGWYRDKKADDHHPVIFDHVEHTWKYREAPGTGVEKVDGMGAGCWLMSRKVAETLGESPYSMEFGGEDLTLCLKLASLDIPLYVDWSINCAHLGVGHV